MELICPNCKRALYLQEKGEYFELLEETETHYKIEVKCYACYFQFTKKLRKKESARAKYKKFIAAKKRIAGDPKKGGYYDLSFLK